MRLLVKDSKCTVLQHALVNLLDRWSLRSTCFCWGGRVGGTWWNLHRPIGHLSEGARRMLPWGGKID